VAIEVFAEFDSGATDRRPLRHWKSEHPGTR
jgi:hypothetical protein